MEDKGSIFNIYFLNLIFNLVWNTLQEIPVV